MSRWQVSDTISLCLSVFLFLTSIGPQAISIYNDRTSKQELRNLIDRNEFTNISKSEANKKIHELEVLVRSDMNTIRLGVLLIFLSWVFPRVMTNTLKLNQNSASVAKIEKLQEIFSAQIETIEQLEDAKDVAVELKSLLHAAGDEPIMQFVDDESNRKLLMKYRKRYFSEASALVGRFHKGSLTISAVDSGQFDAELIRLTEHSVRASASIGPTAIKFWKSPQGKAYLESSTDIATELFAKGNGKLSDGFNPVSRIFIFRDQDIRDLQESQNLKSDVAIALLEADRQNKADVEVQVVLNSQIDSRHHDFDILIVDEKISSLTQLGLGGATRKLVVDFDKRVATQIEKWFQVASHALPFNDFVKKFHLDFVVTETKKVVRRKRKKA